MHDQVQSRDLVILFVDLRGFCSLRCSLGNLGLNITKPLSVCKRNGFKRCGGKGYSGFRA